jgi:cytochrome c oxidase subunit 3
MASTTIDQKQKFNVNPKELLLWLFLGSVSMLFAGLTSAFIVAYGDKSWQLVTMPQNFMWSTIAIVLSSVTMHMAYRSAKQNEIGQIKVYLTLTLLLGLVFFAFQALGYQEMTSNGFFLVGENTNSSFVYLISGIHLAHIISAILAVIGSLISTFKYKVHSKSLVSIRMTGTYWHFLDIVWIYLYFFFLYYNA